jgi:hypothetical protein
MNERGTTPLSGGHAMSLNTLSATAVKNFAIQKLYEKGFPSDLPLKLWKIEHSVKYYNDMSDDSRRETLNVEFDTTHVNDIEQVPADAGVSHNGATAYYNFSIGSDASLFGVDLYISAAVAYSFSEEDRELLRGLGKVEVETSTVTREYLNCTR